MSLLKQKEVENGKRAIWGYGKNFPADSVVGDIFSTTTLARLLIYDKDSDMYKRCVELGKAALRAPRVRGQGSFGKTGRSMRMSMKARTAPAMT